MLYTHNLIENQWEDDTDGLEAMIQFIQKSEEAEQKNIPLKRFTEIRKIIYTTDNENIQQGIFGDGGMESFRVVDGETLVARVCRKIGSWLIFKYL